jgi:hypothetical protein
VALDLCAGEDQQGADVVPICLETRFLGMNSLTNPFELAHERRELHLRTRDSVFVVCPARLPAPLFREAWRSRDHGSSDSRKVAPRRDLQFMGIWSPPPSLTMNSVPDRFAGFATVVQKASPGWKQANGLVVRDLPDLNLLIEAQVSRT